jgi:TP901 family phage tail tape measure protein
VSTGSPLHILESLYVDIIGNATALVAEIPVVVNAVNAINNVLNSLHQGAASSLGAMTNIAGGLATLSGVFANAEAVVVSFTNGLRTTFTSTLPMAANSILGLTSALGGLITFGSAANVAMMNSLGNALELMALRANILGTAVSGLAAQLSTVTSAMSGIAGQVTRFIPRLTTLGAGIRNLTNDLAGLGSISITSMPQLQQMVGFLQSLSMVDSSAVFSISRAIFRLGSGLRSLAGINLSSLLANGNAFLSWVNKFSTINPTALGNLRSVGVAVNRIANLYTASTPPGGGTPSIYNNFTTSVRGVGEAAQTAGRSVKSLTGRIWEMFSSSQAAKGSITMLRFTLLGLAGFGIGSFMKLDQALTRTLMYAGELDAGTRKAVTAGLRSISETSTTDTITLARAMESLTASGMSAGMALDALRISETYAVASGVDAIEATRKLTEIQFGLGKASTDTAKHLDFLTEMTNKFAAVAPVAGMRGSAMMDAFGGQFIATMRHHEDDISFDQSIALVAAFSKARIPGAQAGEYAARLIKEITKADVSNRQVWKQVGISPFEEGTEKLRPLADVVEDLTKVMNGSAAGQKAALLELVKIPNRAFATIAPLLGSAESMRKFEKAARDAGKAAEEQANIIRGSFSGQMKILWNLTSNVAQVIGENLVPVVNVLTRTLASAFRWFVHLNTAFQNLILGSLALGYGLRPIISLLTGLVGVALSPVVGLGRLIFGLGSGLVGLTTGVFGAVWSAVSMIGSGLRRILSQSWSIAETLVSVFGVPFRLFSSIGSIVGSILTSVVTALVSATAALVPFLINLATWLLLLPVIAGVIATIVVGLSQLTGAIFAGAMSAWNSVKEEIPAFFERVAVKANDFGLQAVGVWDRIKANADTYFERVVAGLGVLAGFFWNFGDNIVVIFDWIGKNWRTIANDMGRAFVVIIENMAINIRELGRVILEVLTAAWSMGWETVKGYFTTFTTWLSLNWQYMLDDLGRLFKAFISNLAQNVVTATKITASVATFMATHRSEQDIQKDISKFKGEEFILHPGGNYEFLATYQAELLRTQKGIKAIVDDYTFKGPFDNAELNKQPYMKDLVTLMANPGVNAGMQWDKMLGSFSKTLASLYDESGVSKLLSPLAGFIPKTPNIEGIKTDMPDDALKRLFKRLTSAFSPQTEAMDSGQIMEKQSPGFQFKQISLQRTMLGGDAAMSLDYEQLVTLRQIHNTLLAIQSGVTKTKEPEAEPGPMPREILGP